MLSSLLFLCRTRADRVQAYRYPPVNLDTVKTISSGMWSMVLLYFLVSENIPAFLEMFGLISMKIDLDVTCCFCQSSIPFIFF